MYIYLGYRFSTVKVRKSPEDVFKIIWPEGLKNFTLFLIAQGRLSPTGL
jgi:hypothetical protein